MVDLHLILNIIYAIVGLYAVGYTRGIVLIMLGELF